MTEKAEDAERDDQVAKLELSVGKFQMKAHLSLTPGGLLAIGGLVSGTLLSTAALVWVSTSVARRHPIASRLPLR